jgi:hypothetical protein
MAAFLARYTAELDRGHAAAVTAMWEAWNRREDEEASGAGKPSLQEGWAEFTGRHEPLAANARAWSGGLAERRDLAAELVDFVDNVLK